MDRMGLERVDVRTALQRRIHRLRLKDHLDSRAISDRVLERPNVSGDTAASTVILIYQGPGHISSLLNGGLAGVSVDNELRYRRSGAPPPALPPPATTSAREPP